MPRWRRASRATGPPARRTGRPSRPRSTLAGALADLEGKADAVVVDCLNLWVANLLGREPALTDERLLARTAGLLARRSFELILVSNEVGLGGPPRDRDRPALPRRAGRRQPGRRRRGRRGRPARRRVSAVAEDSLSALLARIEAPDPRVALRTQARLDRLTKPPGSLGRLEELALRVALITGSETPRVATPVIFTLAADHGVAAEGVSAVPPGRHRPDGGELLPRRRRGQRPRPPGRSARGGRRSRRRDRPFAPS